MVTRETLNINKLSKNSVTENQELNKIVTKSCGIVNFTRATVFFGCVSNLAKVAREVEKIRDFN